MIPKDNQEDQQFRVSQNSLSARQIHIDREYDPSPPLPLSKRIMTSIAVVDQQCFTRECIANCLRSLSLSDEVISFTTCEECLQNVEGMDLIVYYTHHVLENLKSDHQESTSLIKLLRRAPVLILSDIDCPECIIEIFENGARGFVPTTNTTIQQINEIIAFITFGGTFVPSSSLLVRKAKGERLAGNPPTSDLFTSTEHAILDRLKLGKPNKTIAYELRISESTVKAHIGRIMKKVKATNRTQIVCRTYDLPAAVMQA